MKWANNNWVLGYWGASVLLSCSAGDVGNPGGTGGAGGGGGAGGATGKVTWCQAYKVLKEKCITCHATPGDPDQPKMTNYAEIKPLAAEIKDELEMKAMPPDGSPPTTDAEVKTLLNWVAEGAKDEGGLNCP